MPRHFPLMKMIRLGWILICFLLEYFGTFVLGASVCEHKLLHVLLLDHFYFVIKKIVRFVDLKNEFRIRFLVLGLGSWVLRFLSS